MLFESKYKFNTEYPKDGVWHALGLSEQMAAENVAALEAGTGPGMRATSGFITPGTLKPGSIVEMNSDGNWVAGSSPTLNDTLPKGLFFLHQGNVEEQGAVSGRLIAMRGAARFETDAVTGSTFAPGDPLYAASGNFVLKVQGDNRQLVGFVGPKGYANGVLDVIFEASLWG